MTMTISGTQRLARWLVILTPAAIPAPVLRVGVRCLVDTLGIMLAGATTRSATSARQVVLDIAAPGDVAVVGSPRRLTASAAAFANGVAAHALDFDDNCNAGFVHGSAVIIPAALAAQSLKECG
ncbi:MmgE/PrpD family protein [Acerihabitans sp. TG2]|uniref:MmgE/PrpD family protein n=1 Tax=Acerihabitans sp. TG2 TaxID=3096008 RepID=UPI002B232947|nr:MmgE/PrpD family protein [Acerihabitans sp. TG2]MEA9391900.1 MmgE/PrpD family protein [Acerihabitans sp. TG2]